MTFAWEFIELLLVCPSKYNFGNFINCLQVTTLNRFINKNLIIKHTYFRLESPISRHQAIEENYGQLVDG
jgi:hypothetical protein